MFDVGFSELLVCFLVALVVLGPERLPKLARSLGRWSGQAKVYLRNLTSELDRESRLMELKQQVEEAQKLLRSETDAARTAVQKSVDELTKDSTPKP